MGTELGKKWSEAEVATWHNLKDVVRRNKEGVAEWLNAVLEIKQSSLYYIKYNTWELFCEVELGKNASTIWRQIQAGQGSVRTQPQLPKLSKMNWSDYDQRQLFAERVSLRLRSNLKGLVRMMDEWPRDSLPLKEQAALGGKLNEWFGSLALWLGDQGIDVDIGGIVREGKRRKS